MHWHTVLTLHRNVARGSELRACGLSRHTLATRLRTGAWQRLLPDILVAHSGPVSIWELREAALLYAGPDSALSHHSAAAVFGLVRAERRIEVTIRNGRRLSDRSFVAVHQSSRPWLGVKRGGLICTHAARTVVDLACAMRGVDDVSGLVSAAVQRDLVSVAELQVEARCLPRRGPALLRRVLEDVATGSRSAGEAAFLRLLRSACLPIPELNAPIHTSAGTFYADALWQAERLVVEIDGAAWHLDALSWRRDLWRQNLLQNAGYRVLRFPVQRLRDDPAGVVAEIRTALRTAA